MFHDVGEDINGCEGATNSGPRRVANALAAPVVAHICSQSNRTQYAVWTVQHQQPPLYVVFTYLPPHLDESTGVPQTSFSIRVDRKSNLWPAGRDASVLAIALQQHH